MNKESRLQEAYLSRLEKQRRKIMAAGFFWRWPFSFVGNCGRPGLDRQLLFQQPLKTWQTFSLHVAWDGSLFLM